MAFRQQRVTQFYPMLDGPVLGFAAAAGMKRNGVVLLKRANRIAIKIAREKARGLFGQRKRESVERSGQLQSGMLAIVELRRSGNKRRGAYLLDVRFENFVRIVKI